MGYVRGHLPQVSQPVLTGQLAVFDLQLVGQAADFVPQRLVRAAEPVGGVVPCGQDRLHIDVGKSGFCRGHRLPFRAQVESRGGSRGDIGVAGLACSVHSGQLDGRGIAAANHLQFPLFLQSHDFRQNLVAGFHVPLALFAGGGGGPVARLRVLSAERVELLLQFQELIHNRLFGGQQLEEVARISTRDNFQLLRSQAPEKLHDLQLALDELGKALGFHDELHL
jgi:hypothetical protein